MRAKRIGTIQCANTCPGSVWPIRSPIAMYGLRDLLCHRIGLSRHDLLWYRAPWRHGRERSPYGLPRTQQLVPLEVRIQQPRFPGRWPRALVDGEKAVERVRPRTPARPPQDGRRRLHQRRSPESAGPRQPARPRRERQGRGHPLVQRRQADPCFGIDQGERARHEPMAALPIGGQLRRQEPRSPPTPCKRRIRRKSSCR